MKRAAFALTIVAALASPAGAIATTATVQVRIEGYERTLFEGPVRGDGRIIRATSDDEGRLCDGTNNYSGLPSGPTPTSISADAMELIGETFDGDWYPGYDDYFITRFGPDSQAPGTYAYWGVLVDDSFTPVGGCQLSLSAGRQVLWLADAFNARPFLRLRPTGPTSWTTGQTITLAAGQALPLTVERYSGAIDGADQELQPAAGITVAPVATSTPQLFQQVLTSDPSAVTTSANGTTSISFSTPGWKRIKAEAARFVRSNRLDICVPAAGQSDCGPLPDDVALRLAPEHPDGPQWPGEPGTPTTPMTTTATPTTPMTTTPTSATAPPLIAVSTAPVRITGPTLRSPGGTKRNVVAVGWTVDNAGPGVRAWQIDARVWSGKPGRWSKRASGSATAGATVTLSAGRTYQLRLTITDTLGRTSSVIAGTVTVPIDDRSSKIKYKGRTARKADAGAWSRTITALGQSSTARVTLAAGRPVVLLRAVKPGTKIELRSASRRQTFSISAGKAREIVAARRSRSGPVTIKLLKGAAGIDGVAVKP